MSEAPRWTAAHDYRALLGRKHEEERQLDRGALLRAELTFNLTRLMNRLNQDFETLHHPTVSWSGFRIMNVLWTLGSVELRDIARLSGASRASIWSALQTLERDGLVERARDMSDKRLVRITLTGRGQEVLHQQFSAQVEREKLWYSVLSAAEADELRLLLERLADQPPPADETPRGDKGSSSS